VLAFARDDDGNFLVVDGAYKPFERSENLQIDDTLRSFVVRRYRPRIEGLFARIERWTRDDGDVHWRTITKDNVLTLYGLDEWSRIADPQNSRRICSWLISETRDDRGNAIVYSYKPEDATGVDRSRAHQANRYEKDKPLYTNRYPKRIQYGNRCSLLDAKGQRPPLLLPSQIAAADFMFEVVFDYGDHDTKAPKPHDDEEKHADGRLKFPWPERADPFSARRAGFEIRTARSVDACFCSITFLDSVRIASCARRISLTGTRGIMQTRAGQSIRF
jgi:hypothetical protein